MLFENIIYLTKKNDIYLDFKEECAKEYKTDYICKSDLFLMSRYQTLPENLIREFKNKLDWYYISEFQVLSEELIEEFQNRVDWTCISIYQDLSEKFIEKFKHKVIWDYICKHQILSEEFIEKFKDNIDWELIITNQILSENFLKKHYNESWFNWSKVCQHQILSESFIRTFKANIDWYCVSKFQILSENFIREFKDYVNWNCIFKYQILSKSFIEEFQYKVGWDTISKYNFISKGYNKLKYQDTCWLYASKNFKLKYIKKHTNYKIINNNHIIAYKVVRKNNCSIFRPGLYKYKVGKDYIAKCDCNIDAENSFGFSAWTKKESLNHHYQGSKLLKIKVNIRDIGAITSSNKIRCKRFLVLE